MAKDPRFDRLPCMHKGTYADDCIVNRVQQVSERKHVAPCIFFVSFRFFSFSLIEYGKNDDLHWVMNNYL